MKVVIMAGGKGERISSVAENIPKPMFLVDGKPILEHQINCLKSQGFDDIIIVIGHLGEQIQQYFGDGISFGVNIFYFVEEKPLGTAGALTFLKEKLSEDFLLIFGDIFFDINFDKLLSFHNQKKPLVTLFTHPNDHPYDSAIIVADENKTVTDWIHKEEKRDFYKNRVNAGIHLFSSEIFDYFPEKEKIDLDRDILKPLISTQRVFAYDSPEYVKDMGTPGRYEKVCEDFLSGKTAKRNLKNKQKAIFLDRDGTLNKKNGFVTTPEALELIEGVAEAVKKINSTEYLAILITNQPVIARGECAFEELNLIHNKLETLLGEKGAYLDGIYFCPHHPEKGHKGELSEYKIECDCRKPEPGMILSAQKDFNIDLLNSYMVGDTIKDVMAGDKAGCRTILLSDKSDLKLPEKTKVFSSLIEFTNDFLKKSEVEK